MSSSLAPAAAPVPADERLLSRSRLPLVVGALALVTLGALENRAVATVLPTVLGELHEVQAFGLVSAAPLATYLVALAAAGWWSDRSGPSPTLRAGVLTFAAAQLLVGLAPTLPVVVAGRLLSGFAEGLLDVGVIVLVARALDERFRPQMMALFAGAWILPSVLGPMVVGLVTVAFGWRWVFLGAVVVLPPVWLVLRPALRLASSPAGPASAGATAGDDVPLRVVLPWALLAAAALVALNVAGEQASSAPRLAVVAVLVATAALAVSARRLLPRGTLRAACGIGGVVALRSAVTAAFMGIGGFLPLMLATLHHLGPAAAGISLSITGVMWSLGSALQSRLAARPGLVLHTGFAALAGGLAVSALLVWTDLPVVLGLAGWAVAGLGIGMTTSTLSVLTLAVSDDASQGRNNAGAQMASGMSGAVFFALAGAVLAVAGPDRAAFRLITAAAVAVAVLGLVGARRALCAVPCPA
ncbi:MFS transporter [Angustibacter sp. McL0619]|uniref:MFS transporter n=1 Tax=Angustibacter sp. McL0619 TaxID=3415676 RepID=UPI003CF551DF